MLIESVTKSSGEAAELFALVDFGRAWILFGSRKNSKPEKCSKTAQNPQRPVRALLGAFRAQDFLPYG
jgi:hypothetical protein